MTLPTKWVPDQILGAFGDVLVARPKDERWDAAWQRFEEGVEMLTVDLRSR